MLLNFDSVLEAIISSKTRIKLLLKFFLNSNNIAYLRGLEAEFGDSSNAIRVELNRLEEAGLLVSFTDGNKKFFQANTGHPLFGEIHNILMKTIGLDQVIDQVINNLGKVERIFLAGEFARGLDNPIIDLIFIGDIDRAYLAQVVDKMERLVKRKIRYVIYSVDEFQEMDWSKFQPQPFPLWIRA